MDLRSCAIRILRWSEKYTKTDMVYLLTNGSWVNLNTIIVTFLSFVLSIAFAHLISKETYGTYQFVLSIAAVIGALTLTGMNTAVTRAAARGHDGTLRTSFRTQLVWGIIPLVVGLAISGYYLLNANAQLSISFIIVAILLPLSSSANTFLAFLSGKKDFKTGFIYSQAVNVSYYGAMFCALFFINSAPLLIFVNLGVNTLVTLALYIRTLAKTRNNLEDPEAMRYGKRLSVINIFMTVALQTDNIVVYHYLGATELALYAFASTIPDRLQGVVKSISQLALPKFATSQLDDIKQTMLGKTFRLLILSLAVSGLYATCAPFIFAILFPQYIASVPYSQFYALAAALFVTSSLPVTALLATRSERELLIYYTAAPIVQIGTLVVFGALWGIWGIVGAKIISGAFMILLSLTLVLTRKPVTPQLA